MITRRAFISTTLAAAAASRAGALSGAAPQSVGPADRIRGNSSLPCLLAVMAVRQGRALTWDGKTAKTT
jgi:hypothetical protein